MMELARSDQAQAAGGGVREARGLGHVEQALQRVLGLAVGVLDEFAQQGGDAQVLDVLAREPELVDEGLVEKKRGRGMFVTDGARIQLLKDERQRFLEKEWPQVAATIERLGLDAGELLDTIKPTDDAGDNND